LESLADTVTPQGVIAVFRVPEASLDGGAGRVVLVLDRVRDPGNAGTLLRSADASGVVGTVAFIDSVDPFAPKVVRAGMGAHFRLNIVDHQQWEALRPRIGARPVYLAAASGDRAYDQVDWTGDSVLVVGGEAEGAGRGAAASATARVSIPMSGPTESLNAAMAGTIILFEAARQRRAQRPSDRKPRPKS
jgi:TrmH family RNA methyltransferase